MSKIKARRRTTIERHEDRLRQLAVEIKGCDADVTKALAAGVHHGLEAGHKLSVAHTLLARVKTKRENKGMDKAPTWAQWVTGNCEMSVRTSYYYMKLHKTKDDILPVLNTPGVSIRKLLRYLSKPLGDAPPPGRQPKGVEFGGDPPTLYQAALAELRERFSAEIKHWTKSVAIFLSDHLDDLDGYLDALRDAAARLASVYAHGVDPNGHITNGPDLDDFHRRVWSALKHRMDLTRYEKVKVIGWLRMEGWLKLEDRRVLRRWNRELNGPGSELIFPPKSKPLPPRPRNKRERQRQRYESAKDACNQQDRERDAVRASVGKF
jgi:hypothetical protein